MVKPEAKQGQPSRRAATRAFERAWKLLGRLEKRLAAARAEEARRTRQLAEATGAAVVRRQAQLDEATANAGRVAALLTELSDMIAANAQAQSRQTVSDFAHAAAGAVRAEEQAKTAAKTGLPGSPIGPARRVPARTAARPPATPPAAASEPAAKEPPLKTPAAKARVNPARVSPATPRPAPPKAVGRKPAGAARPRTRRSLQPGSPDRGPSSA